LNTQLLPPRGQPAGLDAELMDAGAYCDFVRVPAYLGDRVLAALDEHCGAVIRDPYSHLLYWLIRSGGADSWRFPTEACVRVLGTGSSVLVPPPHCDRSAAVYWARPVRAGRVLTRSRRLHAGMQAVVRAEFSAGAAL
jgi:hypothetical protein